MPTQRATIKGGRRLARFVEEAGALSEAAFLEALRETVQSFVIPALRRAAPIRTGKLRRGIRAIIRGGHVEIRAPFYFRFQRRENGQPLTEYAVELIQQSLPQFRGLFRAKLQQRIDAL